SGGSPRTILSVRRILSRHAVGTRLGPPRPDHLPDGGTQGPLGPVGAGVEGGPREAHGGARRGDRIGARPPPTLLPDVERRRLRARDAARPGAARRLRGGPALPHLLRAG